MSEFPLKMSFFSSQQAAHIADISPTNQRNLRRHEYLPALDGKWARYSLDESGAFPDRFFVVLGPKEAFTADALEPHFDKLDADLSGCVVIDLKRLGAKIAARAERHLASVLPTEEDSENKAAA